MVNDDSENDSDTVVTANRMEEISVGGPTKDKTIKRAMRNVGEVGK